MPHWRLRMASISWCATIVEFAKAVALLLGSPVTRLRINGKAVVETRYRWDKVLAPLEYALWNLAG